MHWHNWVLLGLLATSIVWSAITTLKAREAERIAREMFIRKWGEIGGAEPIIRDFTSEGLDPPWGERE